ncbi:hypothetical protein PT974_06233 [Cladobotryum mycophilum]|uniref:Uncharacterized protein n=1 Tax=Cladobotryum mycophilum TaxID=491253 RepID=A0ABR0SKX5_9HYPO
MSSSKDVARTLKAGVNLSGYTLTSKEMLISRKPHGIEYVSLSKPSALG